MTSDVVELRLPWRCCSLKVEKLIGVESGRHLLRVAANCEFQFDSILLCKSPVCGI